MTSNLTVNFSAPAGYTFYSDSACTLSIASVTVTAGTNSANFYFVASNTGADVLTISATGYEPAMQTETINTNGFIWTGAGGDANWNTAANWSGGSAPGAGNVAVFDDSCTANCSPTINTSISVHGIRLASTYTGTITQATGNTITTSYAGWAQLAGTFVGSSAANAISLKSRFSLVGGSFTSTAGTWTVAGDSPYDPVLYYVGASATLLTNSGTFVLDVACAGVSVTMGSVSYNNFEIKNSAGCGHITFTDTSVTVTGNMTVHNASYGKTLNGSTILVGGDLTAGGPYSWGGTTIFKMVGNAAGQTISMPSAGYIPNLEIASGANTVTLSGSVAVAGSYTFTSGTLVTTGSTLTINGGCGATTITPGTVNYNNVVLTGVCITFNFGGATMNVNGDLTFGFTSYGSAIQNVTFAVGGNVTSEGPNDWSGSAIVKLLGKPAGQTIAATGAYGSIPNLTIEAGANPVTISGALRVFNYTATSMGTLTATGSQLHLRGNALTVGAEIYNKVVLGEACTNQTLTGTLKVAGELTFADTCNSAVIGGNISARGNVTFSYSSGVGNGTTALSLDGTSQQTLTQTAFGKMPGSTITINNAAGVVLATNLSGAGVNSFNVVSGNIDMAGKDLNLLGLSLNGNSVTRSGGVLTVNGVVTGGGIQFDHGGTVNP